MRGKNNSDKIEEKRGNILLMINLRFGAKAVLLNPEARRKKVSLNLSCCIHADENKDKLQKERLILIR